MNAGLRVQWINELKSFDTGTDAKKGVDSFRGSEYMCGNAL